MFPTLVQPTFAPSLVLVLTPVTTDSSERKSAEGVDSAGGKISITEIEPPIIPAFERALERARGRQRELDVLGPGLVAWLDSLEPGYND